MMWLASSKGVGMPGLTATFLRHRDRMNEVADVLARYGFAAWVQRGGGLLEAGAMKRLSDRVVDPEIAELSAGERLRRALIELGTTWIKFGQMLSLRPDVVGADIADELTKLQASVPADPPGLAQALVERELGGPVGDLYGSFEAEPFASASVAQVHKATLKDGTTVAVKVLHDGVERRVVDDLDLMQAVATYLEQKDAELAQLRPTLLIDEFSEMMHDAIDLSQELANLQRFTANFAEEPDVVIPAPYPELSRRRVLTMSMIAGSPFTDRASVEAAGWDVDALVHRAADVYLEMIFRDSLYHADPHPGNFLLAGLDAHGDLGLRRRRPPDQPPQTPTGDDGHRRRHPRRRQPRRRDHRDDHSPAVSRSGRAPLGDRGVAQPLPARRHRTSRRRRDHEQRHAVAARPEARAPRRPGVAVPRAPAACKGSAAEWGPRSASPSCSSPT